MKKLFLIINNEIVQKPAMMLIEFKGDMYRIPARMEIKNDPLMKADLKMLSKVETQKNEEQKQKKDLKIKIWLMSF